MLADINASVDDKDLCEASKMACNGLIDANSDLSSFPVQPTGFLPAVFLVIRWICQSFVVVESCSEPQQLLPTQTTMEEQKSDGYIYSWSEHQFV